MALFYGWGSAASRLESLRGGSLLFTTKFPEIPGTHFIDLGRMKGWVDFGATQWFWTRDPWIGNPCGQVFVQVMKNIFKLFLPLWRRLETSSRTFYNFDKTTVKCDLKTFSRWCLLFLVVSLHTFSTVKNHKFIIGFSLIIVGGHVQLIITVLGLYLTSTPLTTWALNKKMKFSNKDFFSKCDQICIFCTVETTLEKITTKQSYHSDG